MSVSRQVRRAQQRSNAAKSISLHQQGPQDRVEDTVRSDKGLLNGSCNRTACQRPLNGTPQWSMLNLGTTGRLYYCQYCAWDFNQWDRRTGSPIRCTPVVATINADAEYVGYLA